MVKPPSNPKLTEQECKVKELTADTLTKRKFEVQLQGVLCQAFNDALRDRQETPKQLLVDLLEQFLLKEKYLPDWWLSRKGKL